MDAAKSTDYPAHADDDFCGLVSAGEVLDSIEYQYEIDPEYFQAVQLEEYDKLPAARRGLPGMRTQLFIKLGV